MSVQTEKKAAGEVIFLQGKNYNNIYCVHGGAVEVLAAEPEFEGLDETLILSHSRRLSLIKDKTYILAVPGRTIRAVSDCTLEKIQFGPKGILDFYTKQPGRAIMHIAYLFRSTELSFQVLQRFTKFYANIMKVRDNLYLLFKDTSGREVSSRLKEPLEETYQAFTENGGAMPSEVKASFLFGDHSAQLSKEYPSDIINFSDYIDKDQYYFLKRFLKLNKTVFAHVIAGDPNIPHFMEKKVMDAYNSILGKINELHLDIDECMDFVFGKDESVISLLIDEGAINDIMASGRLAESFFKEFITNAEKIYQMYKDLTGKDSFQSYPGLESIRSYSKNISIPKHEEHDESGFPAAGGSTSMQAYSNSLQQILNFAEADTELKQTFLRELNNFKQLPNPFTTESDARKVRRQVAGLYWKIYEKVFLKAKKSKSVPPPVKMMLMFGFIDENLIEPDQLPVLHRYASDKYKPSIPIVFEHEFLTRIYSGKEEASVNEMGLTFEKLLREKARSTRNSAAILEKADNPDEKVMYEVENRLSSTTSVCSGSRSTAFPILTSHMVSGNPEGFIVTKAKVEQIFNEIHGIDYSLFYRETVFKIENSREIIEEEVLPYIILLPTFGSKTMMWQELTGTNKRSRARLVIPIFFMGDLKKELCHAFAIFRWELTRTLKGGLWADPVEGGVTGAYSDYIQFFKKNSKLSTDAKQKIAEKFRSARNNVREMFADDYILWMTYEKEGIMKLNTVVRDIMYRYIPFPENIRNNLERMPAFSDSATRFKNIRNRTFAGFERKFRKYKSEDDNYPKEIEKYLAYLRM